MRDKINDGARLALMREAILNIRSFMENIMTCEEFMANIMLCHAVVYNLQCIGEGAYKLSRDFIQSHPGIDWEAIEGLRHVLVHDYYQIDMKMVWAILHQDLPSLEKYLANLPASD